MNVQVLFLNVKNQRQIKFEATFISVHKALSTGRLVEDANLKIM